MKCLLMRQHVAVSDVWIDGPFCSIVAKVNEADLSAERLASVPTGRGWVVTSAAKVSRLSGGDQSQPLWLLVGPRDW